MSAFAPFQVWTSSGSDLYSCSSDGFVGFFNVRKSSFSKFRVGDDSRKHAFYSMGLHPSESSLLLGTDTNVLWVDLDTKLTLRSFGGHVGEVASINVFVGSTGPAFVSHGAGDKDLALSVWSLEEGGKKGAEEVQPAATLNVNESVSAVTAVPAGEGFVHVGAVSRSGVFHAFEYDPASKRKKNKSQRPKLTVQVASEKDAKSGKVNAIPVLASRFRESKLLLAHGSQTGPTFETLDYDSLAKLTCLVRSEAASSGKDGKGTGADGCKYMVRVHDERWKNVSLFMECAILGP